MVLPEKLGVYSEVGVQCGSTKPVVTQWNIHFLFTFPAIAIAIALVGNVNYQVYWALGSQRPLDPQLQMPHSGWSRADPAGPVLSGG